MVKPWALHGSLFLAGELAEAHVERTLQYLASLKIKEPAKILIMSAGGNTDAMFAIIDVCGPWRKRGKLYTIGLGEVASAAALILASGSKRYLYPNAIVGVHEPFVQTTDDPATARGELQSLDLVKRNYFDLLAEFTGTERASWVRALNGRSMIWYSAEQAVHHGLVDGIFG